MGSVGYRPYCRMFARSWGMPIRNQAWQYPRQCVNDWKPHHTALSFLGLGKLARLRELFLGSRHYTLGKADRSSMQVTTPDLVQPSMDSRNTNPSDTAREAAPPSPSDEHLMLAWTQGSSDAFSELFCRYKQPIFGFFRRRTNEAASPAHGPSQAEELTQETFLALLRAASRYEPRALFRTYLYAIAFKILRAHRRKAAFRATFLGRPTVLPEAGVWVRRAVAKLDPIDREILMLREYEQLSYAEIANLLHLPLNTVRSRLFRARSALRNLLEPSAAKPATLVPASAVAPSGERS
jgi:RNA polymerase sigma-70 factor (ECF subfamily)